MKNIFNMFNVFDLCSGTVLIKPVPTDTTAVLTAEDIETGSDDTVDHKALCPTVATSSKK